VIHERSDYLAARAPHRAAGELGTGTVANPALQQTGDLVTLASLASISFTRS